VSSCSATARPGSVSTPPPTTAKGPISSTRHRRRPPMPSGQLCESTNTNGKTQTRTAAVASGRPPAPPAQRSEASPDTSMRRSRPHCAVPATPLTCSIRATARPGATTLRRRSRLPTPVGVGAPDGDRGLHLQSSQGTGHKPTTWPGAYLDGVVLVLNHQTNIHPLDRDSAPYRRREFLEALTFPVLTIRQLYDWWRTHDHGAIGLAFGFEPADTTAARQSKAIAAADRGRSARRLFSRR
jgi:hypothetical protein